MRSSRMRGYGSWTIGWREGERQPPGEPNNGCMLVFCGIVVLAALSVMSQGTPIAFAIGMAIIFGMVNGLKK
jgi:hypothetical protein